MDGDEEGGGVEGGGGRGRGGGGGGGSGRSGEVCNGPTTMPEELVVSNQPYLQVLYYL